MESQPPPFGARALPCSLAFLASFGIFAVEMVAGRKMSYYIGPGLFNWTSVIGVILGGLTIGNFAGGRLADRFEVRKLLATLFLIASVACLAIPVLDYAVGRWFAWDLQNERSFQLRVVGHVTFVYLVPGVILGCIGPVVAKMALSQGFATGRTIGVVYAWGALGCILGTFVTGFLLVDFLHAHGVLLFVAVLLGAAGLVVLPRAAGAFIAVSWPFLLACGAAYPLMDERGHPQWILIDGQAYPREKSSDWLYYDETQYSYIRVTRSQTDGTLGLLLDNLLHALYNPNDEKNLIYDYEKIYASMTERFGRARPDVKLLFLGGGGYVFPRYMRIGWPECVIHVAEIDPAVTEANIQAFGLKAQDIVVVKGPQTASTRRAGKALAAEVPGAAAPKKPMEVYHMDARNHVDDLVKLKRQGLLTQPFDFVYGDAFNDYCPPFHLTTLEFAERVKEILRPDTGLFMQNIIETYANGRFLGSEYKTLKKVFSHVYIFSTAPDGPGTSERARDTFIMVGAQKELDDLAELGKRPGEPRFNGALLTEAEIEDLIQRPEANVLTDDHAPVENLLAPVIRLRTMVDDGKGTKKAKAAAAGEATPTAGAKAVQAAPNPQLGNAPQSTAVPRPAKDAPVAPAEEPLPLESEAPAPAETK